MMLPMSSKSLRSPWETKETTLLSTYRSDFNFGVHHGNPINHIGNTAFLAAASNVGSTAVRPFLAPSYRNLTGDTYISNRLRTHYPSGFRTSSDNPLHRPLTSAPVPTKLANFYANKTFSIAKQDRATVYEAAYLKEWTNDLFVSQRPIKTETQTLRDIIATWMELADSLRNNFVKSRDQLNSYRLIEIFTSLISSMEELVRAHNKLHSDSFELKRVIENFEYAKNVIDTNLRNRSLRPDFERIDYIATEISIIKDKEVFEQQRSIGQVVLKESEDILKSIETFVYKNLHILFEEAKVLFMSIFDMQGYQNIYFRDSNGYIKDKPKIPMTVESWLNLAIEELRKLKSLETKSLDLNAKVVDIINEIGKRCSEQWLETHRIAGNQVEAGLKTHSKLYSERIDTENEANDLEKSIGLNKHERCKIATLNEVCLSKLETKLLYLDSNQDTILYITYCISQTKYANALWSKSNDLLNKLVDEEKSLGELRQKVRRLNTELESCKNGLDHDLGTIIKPRRFNVATHPSVGLVNSSFSL